MIAGRRPIHKFPVLQESLPMLTVKAFHVIFMVTWFAGLFYLPRLFVYHCEQIGRAHV